MKHQNWYEYFTKAELRDIILQMELKPYFRTLINILEENDAYFNQPTVEAVPDPREDMLREFAQESLTTRAKPLKWETEFPPFRLFKDFRRDDNE